MPRRRRGRERASTQASRIGKSITVARRVAGFTQEAAASRAGMSRSTWKRIEAGSASVTLASYAAATDAVGLDLVCQTYPGQEPRLRDSGQLALAERVRAIASPEWRVTLEARAGAHGEAIDMVLRGAAEILAVEIERLVLDWQDQYRRLSLKRAWLAERSTVPVRLVVVVEDTRRNRALIAPHLSLLRSVMPAGSRAVYGSIRSGAPIGADGLCWVRRAQPPPPRPINEPGLHARWASVKR